MDRITKSRAKLEIIVFFLFGSLYTTMFLYTRQNESREAQSTSSQV